MNILKRLVPACLGLIFLFSFNVNAKILDGFFIDHGFTWFNSEAVRMAENEKPRSKAMEEEMARIENTVAEQIAEVNISSAEAMREARKDAAANSPLHILFRIVLAVVLILGGLLLAGNKIPPAKSIVEKLMPLAGTIGLVTVGISLFDLFLDIVTLRPIIGDGLIQAIGIISGGLLARHRIDNFIEHEKLTTFMDTLKENQNVLGFVAMAFGIIHLFMGGTALI